MRIIRKDACDFLLLLVALKWVVVVGDNVQLPIRSQRGPILQHVFAESHSLDKD